MKCSCKRFDDATIGQQSVSEVISSSVRRQSLESPAASPRVTHLLLRDCAKLDLVMDLANLDQNVFQVTDLSLVNIPTINIEFRWEIELETNLREDFTVTEKVLRGPCSRPSSYYGTIKCLISQWFQ